MTQKLVKIDRSKRKKKFDTRGMPKKDAKAVARAEKELEKANGHAPKPRQQSIPGTEEPHIAELAGYADELEFAKEGAKSAGENVKRKEAALIAAMKKHGRRTYADRPRGIFIEITTTEHAKVKKYDHEDNDE